MTPKSQPSNSRFGKRGRVELSAPIASSAQATAAAPDSTMKWLGGGIAAAALVGLLAGGAGGGGLLGGLIGGMLGQKFAKTMTPAVAPASTAHAPSATSAPTSAPASTTVQRSGFGTTGSSSNFTSGS